MDSIVKIVNKAYRTVIGGIFVAILGWLLFLMAVNTCFITATETTYFVRDNVLLNICIVILMIISCVVLKKSTWVQQFSGRLETDKVFFLKCRRGLLLLLFGFSLVWVLSTQYIPGADQDEIQKAVFFLNDQNYDMFAPDGYLSRNPHQLGLVWICYLFSQLFGSCNYICFQIINVLALVVCYYEMAEICAHFGMRRAEQLGVILGGILFFPLIIYCSFLYGNILGLACSLFAIKKELLFLEDRRWQSALEAIVGITMAVLLKSNYLIFGIGMILFALMEGLKRKRVILFILSILIAAGCFAQSYLVKSFSESVSNYTLGGASHWAYIAMGLQDGDRAPGWYNGYVKSSYVENGYNTEIQAEISKMKIREIIQYNLSHKRETVRFFTEKTASQWSNPTFQCFNIVQSRPAGIAESAWVKRFVSVRGSHKSALYLNVLTYIVIAGAFLYGMMFWKREEFLRTSILAMIFVGGFIFHLFWEAKGQYTISYFVLLFPYAISGYKGLAEWLICRGGREKGSSPKAVVKKMFAGRGCLIGIVTAVLLMIYVLYPEEHSGYLQMDTATYLQSLEEEE